MSCTLLLVFETSNERSNEYFSAVGGPAHGVVLENPAALSALVSVVLTIFKRPVSMDQAPPWVSALMSLS